MGTFGYYTGCMNIPEDKREEFTKLVLKLLNVGGMIQFEKVRIFGKEIALIKPPEPDENGRVAFHYNYFEDSAWETVSYNVRNCEFHSGKIGNNEFSDVIMAIYSLYELYDEGMGIALLNADIAPADLCVAWINHVLGTSHSIKKRFRLWEYFEKEYFDALEKGCQCEMKLSNVYALIPKYAVEAVGGIDFSDLCYIFEGTDSLLKEELKEGSYAEAIFQCKELLTVYFHLTDSIASAKEHLYQFLKMGRKQRCQIDDMDLKELGKLSLTIPARAFLYLSAELLKENFWEVWRGLKEDVYKDEDVSSYISIELEEWRRKMREMPVEPEETYMYLRQDGPFTFYKTPEELEGKPNYYLSNDERAFWWDGNEDFLSKEMDAWLKTLAERHQKLTEAMDISSSDDKNFLEDFVSTLHEIECFYKRVYAFRDMYYEFLMNYSDRRYIAAVKLLKELAEENRESGKVIDKVGCYWDLTSKNVTFNEGRRNMKRYLAVMANKELRKKYFRF